MKHMTTVQEILFGGGFYRRRARLSRGTAVEAERVCLGSPGGRTRRWQVIAADELVDPLIKQAAEPAHEGAAVSVLH